VHPGELVEHPEDVALDGVEVGGVEQAGVGEHRDKVVEGSLAGGAGVEGVLQGLDGGFQIAGGELSEPRSPSASARRFRAEFMACGS